MSSDRPPIDELLDHLAIQSSAWAKEAHTTIEQLQAALEFYATPGNYFGVAIMGDRPCGPIADDFGPHDDRELGDEDDWRHGWYARQVLAGNDVQPIDYYDKSTHPPHLQTPITAVIGPPRD